VQILVARTVDPGRVDRDRQGPSNLTRSEKLVTNSDFETDARDQANPLDPDPAAPGVSDEAGDTVGRPVGSSDPVGDSDLIDGAETGDTAEAGARETFTTGFADDSDTED
jgi:hypothetical protein